MAERVGLRPLAELPLTPLPDPVGPARPPRRWRRWLGLAVAVVVYAVSWRLTKVDLSRLASGLSTMFGWAAKAWPPDTEDFSLILRGAGETVAIAVIGTTLAAVIALTVAGRRGRSGPGGGHRARRRPARRARRTATPASVSVSSSARAAL